MRFLTEESLSTRPTEWLHSNTTEPIPDSTRCLTRECLITPPLPWRRFWKLTEGLRDWRPWSTWGVELGLRSIWSSANNSSRQNKKSFQSYYQKTIKLFDSSSKHITSFDKTTRACITKKKHWMHTHTFEHLRHLKNNTLKLLKDEGEEEWEFTAKGFTSSSANGLES